VVEVELLLECVEEDEPTMVDVKTELVGEEEEMLLAELTMKDDSGKIEVTVLELVWELETMVLENNSNAEDIVEVLLDILDTTTGSEYIDDTGVLSCPGPMIYVGFETTGDTELQLEVKKGSSELLLGLLLLLTLVEVELTMALGLVLPTGRTMVLLDVNALLPELLVKGREADVDMVEECRDVADVPCKLPTDVEIGFDVGTTKAELDEVVSWNMLVDVGLCDAITELVVAATPAAFRIAIVQVKGGCPVKTM
jgi:hypothetical protein